ncbi:MAG: glycosyltransferase [Flavobacteriales bacterium]|nr:glycosyltransferase [Flavobacteriales bacterium]
MKNTAPDRVLVLTSYPPRVCGIATYTQDLVSALNKTFSGPDRYTVCAVENSSIDRAYPSEVTHRLNAMYPDDHIRLAGEVDRDESIKRVWVQHEFGLYQAGEGQYLLRFLNAVSKPVAITFHTVLTSPSAERAEMVRALGERASDIVVLTERSARVLRDQYGIEARKISVVPHGTHAVQWIEKQRMKEKHGLQGRRVLSTFGLLSANKDIEMALDALVSIKERVPNVLYLVLGRTHPEVVQQEGEQYREMLLRKVDELGLQDHVRFVDRYLELDELLDYLQLTDVYLFTSKDPQQAVSGTFAYAMGSGCPVISTRIPHAAEVLDEGTGVLIDFNSPDQLAQATIALLLDPERMDRMARNALHRMRATAWENVAIAHARAFARRTGTTGELRFQWPPITLGHLSRLTDRIGMVQFCDLSEPDIDSGHTLDDNARALIAVCIHADNVGGNEEVRDLASRYLEHIVHCQQPDGRFLNYTDIDGAFTEQNFGENLDDSHGRALWALGICVAHGTLLDGNTSQKAEQGLRATFHWAGELTSPRAMAFAIKGLHAYNTVRREERVTALIDRLAARLQRTYADTATANWNWFEPILTYGNAALPEAMLLAYLETKNDIYRETAQGTFSFLLAHLFKGDMLRVISNRTWMEPGITPDQFGEQPIDVAYTISALALFHDTFGIPEHARKMHLAFEWFLGRNHLAQVMYNRATGGCYDGLEEHSVNLNQGAESTVCYLIARSLMERSRKKAQQQRALRPVRRTSALVVIPEPLRPLVRDNQKTRIPA